jgi:hypothetical protein
MAWNLALLAGWKGVAVSEDGSARALSGGRLRF